MTMHSITVSRTSKYGQTTVAVAEHANSFIGRLKGLLGKSRIDKGAGLLISPCSQVHTMGMRFNLDVVFLDASGTVIKVVHNLPPFRMAGAWGAKHVLELPANSVQALQLHTGTHLSWH